MLADVELLRVFDFIRNIERAEERIGQVLRNTYDQIYDGLHTGRYRWDQLRKTEKTHFGSLVEINLQREFDFEDGRTLDFLIGGVETDCKFSQDNYAWMIPVEAVDQVCLVLTADETAAIWNAGLVRATIGILGAPNRDQKRRLTAEGRQSVSWLWNKSRLPPNVLLQIPQEHADAILGLPSGQKRVNQLFRLVQGQVIPRGTIATVAQQEDYMKRVRSNGGARSQLRKEGIVIFGHYRSHAMLAAQLGLPVPANGQSLSARLAPADASHGVKIDGGWWRLAGPEDTDATAPELPRP